MAKTLINKNYLLPTVLLYTIALAYLKTYNVALHCTIIFIYF
jgi:hypothetical protein